MGSRSHKQEVKEYLGSEVLVGKEGNSFYGSRFGNSFRCGGLVLRFKFNDNGNNNGNGINGETLEVLWVY